MNLSIMGGRHRHLARFVRSPRLGLLTLSEVASAAKSNSVVASRLKPSRGLDAITTADARILRLNRVGAATRGLATRHRLAAILLVGGGE